MNGLIWGIMTSDLLLSFLVFVLLAAVVVGWFPLLKYLPAIGAYVSDARLVAVLVLVAVSFLLGFRTSDERESVERLRATLAARDADIAIAAKSRALAEKRASEIEAAANAQMRTDADYIASLVPADACAFDPGPVGVRARAGNALNAAARPSAGSR